VNFAGVKSITIPEGDVRSIALGGVTVWQKPNPLPYDAEVEYVESTGTQYVDTGVLVDPTVHSFLLDCSFEGAFQNTNSVAFIDARDTNANNPIKVVTLNFGGNANQNKTVLCWFENQGGQRNSFAQNFALERGALSYSNGVVTRNGISISVPTSSGLRERTLLLCARRYADNSTITAFGAYHVRVYGFTISSGSTLVRDFVPVRVGSVGYLFDRVSGQLFGNSGTGDFVCGPDKNGG
jgi:hypothetical protein